MSYLPGDGVAHQPMAGPLSKEPAARQGCGEMKTGVVAAPFRQGLMDLEDWNGVLSHGQGGNILSGLGRDCQPWDHDSKAALPKLCTGHISDMYCARAPLPDCSRVLIYHSGEHLNTFLPMPTDPKQY